MIFSTLLGAMPGAVSQGLIWGIMALGVYITFRILDIADLTVGGTMCTGGAVFVILTMHGVGIPIALLCAFLAGLAAGFVTGVLHTFCGIPAILSGILTWLALYSVNLRILGWGGDSGKANLSINASNYNLLISSRNVAVLEFQNPIFVVGIFTIAIIALLRWFFGTEQGAALRATGANPSMARAAGVNTSFSKVLGLMLSNGLVALSSALFCQYQGFVDVNMGKSAIIIGLAAIVVGEGIFGRITVRFVPKLIVVVSGAIIYYVVLQTVIVLRLLRADDTNLATAVIIALFMAVPYWKGKYFAKRLKGGIGNA
ncbi:MAG: ABC transporter permease [Firmicutes bacterium]|nr:ABC transporter permease [Bacillota bacterium]